jgi:hypothetical protein
MELFISEYEIINQIKEYDSFMEYLSKSKILERDFPFDNQTILSFRNINKVLIVKIIKKSIKNNKDIRKRHLILVCNIITHNVSDMSFRPILIFSKYFIEYINNNLNFKDSFIISGLKGKIYENKAKEKKEIAFSFVKDTKSKGKKTNSGKN